MPMLTARAHAALLRGVEAVPLEVTATAAPGRVPGLRLTGPRESAVLEMRSRVRCALRSSGFEADLPAFVDVAPADLAHAGRGAELELAVAASYLAATGQVPSGWLDGALLYGRVSLDGGVEAADCGTAAAQALAARSGLTLLTSSSAPRVLPPGPHGPALGVDRLSDLRGGIGAAAPIPHRPLRAAGPGDLSDIAGHPLAKRALSVALAGRHGICLVGGPDGLAEAMARRLGGVMPPAGPEEAAALAALMDSSTLADAVMPVAGRPFRHVDCSVPRPLSSLVGGGRPVRPGEVTLASGGVLYLHHADLLPKAAAQMLAAPLRDGRVDLVRVDGRYRMPASCSVVAHSPDGAAWERSRPWLGPLLAPMAVRLDEPGGGPTQGSAELRSDVEAALRFRAGAGPERGGADGDAVRMLAAAEDALAHWAARALAEVARTCADMDLSPVVRAAHVREAAAYMRPHGVDLGALEPPRPRDLAPTHASLMEAVGNAKGASGGPAAPAAEVRP